MILSLKVTNFAIIEDIEIPFEPNMTVLTGKTGAGKSLIIDCIGLLLGARADTDMIRYHENKAYVSGKFEYHSKRIDDLLEGFGIPKEEDILLIERTISKSSGSTIKINGCASNLSALKAISQYLADIHVQFDTQRLIQPEHYLEILDQFQEEEISSLLNDYQLKLFQYKESYKKYKEIESKKNHLVEQLDLYQFQDKELSNANLQIGELEELDGKISVLSHFDKILDSLNETDQCLNNEYFSVSNLYDGMQNLKKISNYQPKYLELAERLESLYYELSDVSDAIKREINSMDYDPRVLEELQERKNYLEDLQKKYHMTIPEIIEYHHKIELEIQLSTNYGDVLNDAHSAVLNAYKRVLDAGDKLSKKRKKIAQGLEKEIAQGLEEVLLPSSEFHIEFFPIIPKNEFDVNAFMELGLDSIDFLISFNKGEGLKSLSKTASGGELSRIMLVLKSILAKSQRLSLMVFDEIDSGISGQTATQIAKKMKKISEYSQVLAITHLPNVAAIADHEIHIEKQEVEERTKISFTNLTEEQRILEIAKMIFGDRVNQSALDIASEMRKEGKKTA